METPAVHERSEAALRVVMKHLLDEDAISCGNFAAGLLAVENEDEHNADLPEPLRDALRDVAARGAAAAAVARLAILSPATRAAAAATLAASARAAHAAKAAALGDVVAAALDGDLLEEESVLCTIVELCAPDVTFAPELEYAQLIEDDPAAEWCTLSAAAFDVVHELVPKKSQVRAFEAEARAAAAPGEPVDSYAARRKWYAERFVAALDGEDYHL